MTHIEILHGAFGSIGDLDSCISVVPKGSVTLSMEGKGEKKEYWARINGLGYPISEGEYTSVRTQLLAS